MSTGLVPKLIRHLRQGDPSADADLVRRFVALRDELAFEELLRRHAPLVWGVCRRRLPNRTDAEDAFQSTFLVLAKRATAIRRPEALGCWLYGVAHRVAGRMRGRAVVSVPEGLPSPTAPVAETAAVREFLAALDEELIRLPEKLRGPLVLCFLQERTQDEAAKQLGVSLSTLKRRLDAGRELLRVRLRSRGVELSAALAAVGLAVPMAVADAAVRAAMDGVAAGLVSANVLTVTEGVVRAMTYTKLKAWTAGVLMAATTVGGTGYFAATGTGQTGGTNPIAKQTGKLHAATRAEILQAEADVRVAELEIVKAQTKLQTASGDLAKRIAEGELRVAEAKLQAAKARLEAIEEQATRRQREVDEYNALVQEKLATDLKERERLRNNEQLDRPDDLRPLRQQKLKLAQEMLKLVTERFRAGQQPFTDVYEWSNRVLETQREVASDAPGRLQAAREHFGRMQKLSDQIKGSDDPLQVGTAKLYLLEAEIWAKADDTRGQSTTRNAAVQLDLVRSRDNSLQQADSAAKIQQLQMELEKAKVEAAAEKQRAERLAEQLKELLDKQPGRGIQPLLPFQVPFQGNAPPLIPMNFRGTVRRVEGTANDLLKGGDVWVELTPGLDAGLMEGAILSVLRVNGGNSKFLGTITVKRVNAKDAVGFFSPAKPHEDLAKDGDDLPKKGDQLVPKSK